METSKDNKKKAGRLAIIANLSIARKIALLAGLPALAVVLFLYTILSDRFTTRSEVEDIVDLSRYTVQASALIHELQKERGMSAVYIGSAGKSMISELPEQIRNSTEKYEEFLEFLSTFEARKYGTEFDSYLSSALSGMKDMASIQGKTRGLQHAKGEAISFYTGTISQLFETFKQVVILAGGSELATPVSAYYNLLYGKEKAGIERARMAGAAGANTAIPSEDLEAWMEVWKGQQTYLANFQAFASESAKKTFDVNHTGTVVDKVTEIRNHLLENRNVGNFSYTGPEIFQATTARINILKTVEDFQAGEILEIADAVSASARNAIMVNSVLGLVIMAVVLAFSVIMARSITNPVKKLLTGLEALGDGDLRVQVDVDTKDEIGAMAEAFNKTTDNLKDVMKQIGVSSEQVGKASEQISSASEQLAAGSEEQQAQLSEVATTMEQMSAMILESSKNADETRQNAQQTGSTAQEGREIVSETVSGFETVNKTVDKAAEQIEQLNRRSEEIGNVIQVIDDIADQTNLLALNANIEAARAGDAGRGFAVVADEVRKLAERTVSATAEISSMIESIQNEIKGAVQSMGEIQEQSQRGMELVGKSDQSLEEISGAITNVVGAVEQIATSTNEQSSGAEEISKNIEGVSTVAKESANSAQDLASSAEELNREIEGLNSLLGQFKV